MTVLDGVWHCANDVSQWSSVRRSPRLLHPDSCHDSTVNQQLPVLHQEVSQLAGETQQLVQTEKAHRIALRCPAHLLEMPESINTRFGLSANEFSQELFDSITVMNEEIKVSNEPGKSHWKYSSIASPEMDTIRIGVCSQFDDSPPATDLGKLMVRAWIRDRTFLSNILEGTNTIIRAVVFRSEEHSRSIIAKRLLAMADSMAIALMLHDASNDAPLWCRYSNITIGEGSLLSSPHPSECETE